MPITVKHGGGDIGGLALLALLAGAGQQKVPEAPQVAVSAPGLGGGGGGGIRRSPQPQGPVLSYSQAIKEDALRLEMEKKKQEARIEANQWESKFSAKQRQEIAGFNQARQEIAKSPRLTPQEKEMASRIIDLQQANITPSMMPRDPSKPTPEEVERMRSPFIDENTGGLLGYDRSGSPRVLVLPDKMPEAIRQKQEFDLQVKREDKLLELRAKLATEDIIVGEGENRTVRQRTQGEVDTIMQTVAGVKEEVAWYDSPRVETWDVREEDKDLPPQVGVAQAYLRTMKRKYGSAENVPKDKRAATAEAAEILRQYTSVG